MTRAVVVVVVVVVVIGLVIGLARGGAYAATPARLEYSRGSGAEACPDAGAIARDVSLRLGGFAFTHDATLTISATIARSRQGLVARVELRDRVRQKSGVRTLTSSKRDCGELVAAVVLAICIAIDPLHFNRGAPAVSTSTSVVSQQPDPKPRGVVVAGDGDVDIAITTQYRAGVGLVIGVGSAPDMSLGLALQGGLRRGALSLALEGRADLPSSLRVPGGRVSSSLLVGSLIPCIEVGVARGCAVVTAGLLRGQGHELADARIVTSPYVAAGGRVGLEIFSFDRYIAVLHAELSFNAVKTILTASGIELWAVPDISGAFALTVVGNFS